MRLSSASSSPLDQKKNGRSPRLRKKHKRLDAICEEEYNRNHNNELNEDSDGDDALGGDTELRRSTRVRRPPLLLDASPPPAKKRRKLGKNVVLRGVKDVKSSERVNQGSDHVETTGTWSKRLRSRDKNVGLKVKEEVESPNGKRRLFEDVDGSREEENVEVIDVDEKEELKGGMLKIVKSKRPGRIKATKHAEGHKDKESHGNLDENKIQEVEHNFNKDEESAPVLEKEISGENEIELVDVNAAQEEVGNEEGNIANSLPLECNDNVEPSSVEQVEKQIDHMESVKEGINESDVVEEVGISREQVENEGSLDKQVSTDERTLQDENTVQMTESKQASNGMLGQPRIKEGRRCGLCGGGTDGKPPKRLVQDNGESENEPYSGSSASEDPNYDIWDGFGDEPGWLGRLLGPINDRNGIARIWVHQHCAVWSPEVYFAGLGCLKNVRAALYRGRALKCTRCGRRGATIGCRVDRCPRTYHLPCARANGCIFDHRKFLIACTDHRRFFQPYGNQYLAHIKKLKARKMKLEIRKLSNDAWRKDIEAEERWLEKCGEDEEFLKRESKRLHRDILRIAPVYIGGSDSNSEKSFQGWESVAGLKDVIRCMKEVVILPLLYPEFFDNLGLTPPRGVLLHGYPGTGKTLVVRALIGACAQGDKRIAYFARKGADCLGKYVGDAERQLRLLFQVAERCQPSIIFFDEIDGLAPCRTRHQDQTHSSVVSTLLALMDGLKSRGSVVVIGATNRPEAVDPALRRPGRFDREIYFPLPSLEDRASILSLHTQRWPKPLTGSLLEWIARKTPGFAGADLQALCTQAAMNALKRKFPLQEVLSAAGEKDSGCKGLPLPSFAVEERDWLEALSCSPPPCSQREAGNAANDAVCSSLPVHLIPCLFRPLCILLVSLYLDEHLWLPRPISKAVMMIKNVMISVLEEKKMSIDHWWLHVDDFLQEADVAAEVQRKLTSSGILSLNDGFADSNDPVDNADDDRVIFEPSIKYHAGTRIGLLSNTSSAPTNRSGFRILIAGNPRSGQRHLASCLLYCFVGNVEIQKIDMATISQEGHGDVTLGIAQILMRCASVQSSIVFMPRIDLWAVETCHQINENTDSCSANHEFPEMDESCSIQSEVVKNEKNYNPGKSKLAEMPQGQACKTASPAWMTFIEQVESIGVSTSLMILATSEVPYPELPFKIREFFRSYQARYSQTTPLEQKVPQFSLQIDGNFNHDVVINLSTVELLRNIFEHLAQLIHYRCHKSTQKGYRTYDSVHGCKDRLCQREEDESSNEIKSRIQLPQTFTEVPPPPNSRSLKGKSNLAILSFGYQILRYPHFAELCWITSKLKEGPSADVNGPWKGWPFNSCIIRPNNSVENVAISCSSGNSRSKERSGMVRGLIAVGLSAYSGVYTSVREVSVAVREVLEILVRQINTKVQAGKDRYQYLRVLSQVAYFEDMVNNWAYSLRSLEQDSPEPVAKPASVSVGSLKSHHTYEANVVEDKDRQLNVPMEGHEPEMLERNPEGIDAETPGYLNLNNRNDDLIHLNLDGRGSISEASPENHSLPDKCTYNSASANQLVDLILNGGNGTLSGGRFESENENVAESGELGSGKDLNGFTLAQSVSLPENECYSACEPENVEIRDPKVSDHVVSISSPKTGVKVTDSNSGMNGNAIDINASPGKDSDPAQSEVICLYQCCRECVYSLYHLTKKILVHEWGLNSSHRTVEDVHDVVESLSVDLIAALRKFYAAEDCSDLSNKTFRHEKHVASSLERLNLRSCNPTNPDTVAVPAECTSHSTSQHATTSEDTAMNELLKLNLRFVFRDGVLVHMDPDKDVSLHCKFETLCLCSLRELMVMTKGPFD